MLESNTDVRKQMSPPKRKRPTMQSRLKSPPPALDPASLCFSPQSSASSEVGSTQPSLSALLHSDASPTTSQSSPLHPPYEGFYPSPQTQPHPMYSLAPSPITSFYSHQSLFKDDPTWPGSPYDDDRPHLQLPSIDSHTWYESLAAHHPNPFGHPGGSFAPGNEALSLSVSMSAPNSPLGSTFKRGHARHETAQF
jgi:hypothetical protein